MPSHWGHRRLNIVSQGSPTGTQCLQAVGCAEAGLLYRDVTGIPGREAKFHPDEVVFVSLGEGATSEGEFWESLNTACVRALPVVYLVENNEYAISVPVEVQTAGGDIGRLVSSFPRLKVVTVDGTDVLASHAAMREAVDYARERRGPALVHARVIRPYSHSLSDDEKLYKPPAEREAESARDPIPRFARFLLSSAVAADSELKAIANEVQDEVNEAAERALAAERPPRDTAAWWVFSPHVDPTSEAFRTSRIPAERRRWRWCRGRGASSR
jgi:2-oxoisovalerate dehydrogenase E1 component